MTVGTALLTSNTSNDSPTALWALWESVPFRISRGYTLSLMNLERGMELKNLICCTPKSLPREKLVKAAMTAVAINPLNHAPAHQLLAMDPDFQPTRERIAVMTLKYWG